MALSPGDQHSYARPELARVTHTHLELNVDFGLKVLEGKAILDIEWEPSSNEIILDSYGLVVSSVTDTLTQINLEHQVGHCGTLGSKFAIQLLQNVYNCNNRCRIQIKYKTRPSSPALYWLTPEQTADGKYSFLLSNNKLTYARAWFPCQDTPSIKTTYSATIVAPMSYTVLMSASSVTKIPTSYKRMIYKFSQKIPIPSYAVVIAVGVLEHDTLSYTSKIGVWAERKFLSSSKQTFLILETENMLQIAESLCGSYPWD
ncbi:leukotriene A-4 hydrolase-like [Temnothorax longispinosus]|uniref:leukotriene A-4 hydrolase-like n=1 Tax=Temnothorax longispinosus TaxID=300112 RepID=UPI003A994DEB